MATKATKATNEKTIEPSVRFTREQLIGSKRYKDKSDLINALLDADKTYSIDEVDAKIQKYLKGEVH